jgi:hypothetical protein
MWWCGGASSAEILRRVLMELAVLYKSFSDIVKTYHKVHKKEPTNTILHPLRSSPPTPNS